MIRRSSSGRQASVVLQDHQFVCKLGALDGAEFRLGKRMPVLRLIDTARFRRQRIASEGIRSCPGPAADFLVLAGPAFALETARIAQRFEDGCVAVDIGQWLLPDVAGLDGQEAAGVNVANVRDKKKTFAIVDAARGPAVGTGSGVCRGLAGFICRG